MTFLLQMTFFKRRHYIQKWRNAYAFGWQRYAIQFEQNQTFCSGYVLGHKCYFFEVLKIPFWNHKSSRIFLKALFYAGLQRSSLRIVRNIEKRGLSESCKPPFNLHRQAEQPDLFDFQCKQKEKEQINYSFHIHVQTHHVIPK